MWVVTVERNTVVWLQQFFIRTYTHPFHGNIKIFAENTFNLRGAFILFVGTSFRIVNDAQWICVSYDTHAHTAWTVSKEMKNIDAFSSFSSNKTKQNNAKKSICGETNVTFDLKQGNNSMAALSFYLRQTAFFWFGISIALEIRNVIDRALNTN